MARGGVGVEYRPKLTPIYDFEPARMKRSCARNVSLFLFSFGDDGDSIINFREQYWQRNADKW